VIEREGACPGQSGASCFVLFHVSRHGTLVAPTNCIGVAVSLVPQGPYVELGPLKYTDGGVDASGRPPGCGDDGGYSNIDPAPFMDGDAAPTSTSPPAGAAPRRRRTASVPGTARSR
jgi:hypothetical protein